MQKPDQLNFNNRDRQRYPFNAINQHSFFFVTDQSCYYSITMTESGYFINNTLLHNGGELFEISFDRNCDNSSKYDPLVNVTVRHILSSLVASKGDRAVFYFMCDNNDGKGSARSRVFNSWFSMEQGPHLFNGHLETIIFVNPDNDEEVYYLGLIISNQHPSFDQYIAEFKLYLSNEYFPNKTTLFD